MMFFSLYVEQNRWIIVTLLGGLSLVILFCLVYRSMWRSRTEVAEAESRIGIRGIGDFFRWVLSFTPWVLLLIVIASIAYTATHLYMAATTVPNW